VASSNASPIHAFGLFWRVDEIEWFPGKGKAGFRLLGRRGLNSGTLQVTNFRSQRGIYILYGNYGPHYTGLVRNQDLGVRLKQHLTDHHAGLWDRFSWFGFRQVLSKKDSNGFNTLKAAIPQRKTLSPHNIIKEMEALLVKAMALTNRADSKFILAAEWHQVRQDEQEKLLAKL